LETQFLFVAAAAAAAAFAAAFLAICLFYHITTRDMIKLIK